MTQTASVLRTFLDGRVRAASIRSDDAARLWADLADGVGGKLMRPRLAVAAYLGLGGRDDAVIAPVAAAIEVLHTAMLVHDDLLDHDEVRRGRPNVAGATRARLEGRGVAERVVGDQVLAAGLLAGDLAIASAFSLVVSAPAEREALLRVVGLLAEGIETTVVGELLDVTAALSSPRDVDALAVAELKTAAYSGSLPLVVGAILAGAAEARIAQLAAVGSALGVAFQLTDDELGVFGDPAVTGKSVVSDLREGKRTELLRRAYAMADEAGCAVLDAHVGRADLDEPGAAAVRAVMVSSGALDTVRELTRTTGLQARGLALAGVPGPLGDYLVGVVDDLVGRGH
ncbi:polyprenyl synthetase family protein [Cellulomonas fengjieae]|uniref:polyprenyl synthetase family protein n=1 Tax=Cellulomonas fengjieae TaxID=2819978 RepID=UPI001AAFEDBC|nr:polyprenyl synthetase family protein [Cellulomonas fengjieae]MBO3101940.1 polyprenyl synthetase family protein [Cellulomonas fengjieae]